MIKSKIPQYSRLVIPLINSILRINKYEIIKWNFYEESYSACYVYGWADDNEITYDDFTKMKGILDSVSELLLQIGVTAELSVIAKKVKEEDFEGYCLCFLIWFSES